MRLEGEECWDGEAQFGGMMEGRLLRWAKSLGDGETIAALGWEAQFGGMTERQLLRWAI